MAVNRKKYTVTIPKPCNEGWNNMSPRKEGRHCQQCDKVVVDFTKMSDSEIVSVLTQSKKNNKRVCGHFKSNQINRSMRELVPYRNRPTGFLIVATLLSGLSFLSCHSQTPVNDIKTEETIHLKGDVAFVESVDTTAQIFQIVSFGGIPIKGAKISLTDSLYRDKVYVTNEKGFVKIEKIGLNKIFGGVVRHPDFDMKYFEFEFGRTNNIPIQLDDATLVDGMVEGEIIMEPVPEEEPENKKK